MTDTELKKAYDMFSDLWRFYRRFCNSSNADEYWQAVSLEANRLRRKYPKTLCKRMLLVMADEFEGR